MSVSLSLLNNYPTQPSVDNAVIANKNVTSDKENQTLTASSTVVTLSEEGKQLSNRSESDQNAANDENSEEKTNEAVSDKDKTDKTKEPDKKEPDLTEEEQEEVEYLQDRDLEVKIHEQAHASVGGQYAGAPSYTFEKGPDGQSYAVAGEVPIDVSPIAGDPQATISKMEQVYRAALAPVAPSSADRSIASDAQSKISEARVELAQPEADESDNKSNVANEEKPSKEDNNTDTATPRNDSRISSYSLSPNILGGTISQSI